MNQKTEKGLKPTAQPLRVFASAGACFYDALKFVASSNASFWDMSTTDK